jgi:hypothetical protein
LGKARIVISLRQCSFSKDSPVHILISGQACL